MISIKLYLLVNNMTAFVCAMENKLLKVIKTILELHIVFETTLSCCIVQVNLHHCFKHCKISLLK